ncbi:MAG: YesU family protein [Candidatus Marinimicrobia bacterium]|nr:YesU family protein [Candidatus Neomarinimicrobiota bacterium]
MKRSSLGLLALLTGSLPGVVRAAADTGARGGPLDLAPYPQTLVYEADFSRPLEVVNESELFEGERRVALPEGREWVLEGEGARAWTEGGRLHLANRTATGRATHAVLWNTRAFPADFLLEFGFAPADANLGLAIVFFAARSRAGGGIFDLALPARQADFPNYHTGELDCYHVSYWAIDPKGRTRGFANLRKNHGFHVLGDGADLIAGQGAGPHRVRLLKVGGHIQLEVNGQVALDRRDDGQQFGPVLGGGAIGLRQMKHSGAGSYTHFKLWEIAAQ